MSPSAAPPSPQEISRKLSVHSVARSPKPPSVSVAQVSGTESDSDSYVGPDVLGQSLYRDPASVHGGSLHAGTSAQPLSSIAERRSGSGEDTEEEEEEEEEEAGWKAGDVKGKPRGSVDESVIKAGYLWKKGERRKTWKKRWFVLRPAHLAYYKTSAEYQLHRLLELSEVHSCTQVALKKHSNTFGLISPVRTFYLQTKTPGEVQEWVQAIEDAREALLATSTQNSVTSPIPIPRTGANSRPYPPITPSPPTHQSHAQNITSSDSEDASPMMQRSYSASSQQRPVMPSSPTRTHIAAAKDPTRTILAGYLMKCGSKRRNWRKRWFVLTGEKLVYSGSHMDTKPHRQFSFAEILDALEYDLPPNRQNPALMATPVASPPSHSPGFDAAEDTHRVNTFKIVTTKRSLLLCAPGEEDEIKWLGAIRALIARRSGAGVVPREAGVAGSKTAGSAANDNPLGASGIGSGGSGGTKGKARRLSASGSGGVTGVVIPGEGA